MKFFTWKRICVFDLILVSLWGLFVWHTAMSSLVFPMTFVLLRLLVAFGLIERRRGSWLPIVLFSGGLLATLALPLHFFAMLFEQIPFDMAKVMLLLMGDARMDQVFDLDQLLTHNDFGPEICVVYACSFLLWAWVLLYPVLAYLRLWRKKGFEDDRWWNGKMAGYIGLLFLAILLTGIISISLKIPVWRMMNLWLLLVCSLCGWSYSRSRKQPAALIQHYAVYLLIFAGAYIVGRETETFLSFFGIVAALLVFYVYTCHICQREKSRWEWILLIVSGMLFWEAQFTTEVLRMLCLLGAFAMAATVSLAFYKTQGAKLRAFFIGVSLAFVLPVLSIGYSPYSVLHAQRQSKFEAYTYAYNGIMYIIQDGKRGLRDRYTEILPCEYGWILLAGGSNSPYLKVEKDGLWGLFDLSTQKLLLDPVYQSIYQYDNRYFRLTDIHGKVSYYRKGPRFVDGVLVEDENHITDFPYEEVKRDSVLLSE